MTIHSLAVAGAGLAFACFGATDLRELIFQVAVPCETAPGIDGAMDDACWAKAPAHTTYYQYYVANPPATNGYADCRIVYFPICCIPGPTATRSGRRPSSPSSRRHWASKGGRMFLSTSDNWRL